MSKLIFLTIEGRDEVAIVASKISAVTKVFDKASIFIDGDSSPFKVQESFEYITEKLQELIKD